MKQHPSSAETTPFSKRSDAQTLRLISFSTLTVNHRQKGPAPSLNKTQLIAFWHRDSIEVNLTALENRMRGIIFPEATTTTTNKESDEARKLFSPR